MAYSRTPRAEIARWQQAAKLVLESPMLALACKLVSDTPDEPAGFVARREELVFVRFASCRLTSRRPSATTSGCQQPDTPIGRP